MINRKEKKNQINLLLIILNRMLHQSAIMNNTGYIRSIILV